MSRLLLLSCSRSKRTNVGLLPAYKRYDGPAFRLLRRYLNTSKSIPDIRVLSAEYGLIPYDFQIPYYERRMTAQRAQELQPHIMSALHKLLKVGSLANEPDIFLHLGKDYLRALEGSNIFPSKSVVTIVAGTPGKRLAELYSWLYRDSSSRERQWIAKRHDGNIQIRGIQIRLSKAEVLEKVRRGIQKDMHSRFSYHSWYVLIDGYRVSPKWIINLLTGLPLGSFHTDEARRVLNQLGIRVHTI